MKLIAWVATVAAAALVCGCGEGSGVSDLKAEVAALRNQMRDRQTRDSDEIKALRTQVEALEAATQTGVVAKIESILKEIETLRAFSRSLGDLNVVLKEMERFRGLADTFRDVDVKALSDEIKTVAEIRKGLAPLEERLAKLDRTGILAGMSKLQTDQEALGERIANVDKSVTEAVRQIEAIGKKLRWLPDGGVPQR